MKYILVHIECNQGGSESLAELGIDTGDTEYRECMLNVNYIAFMYPNSDGGTYITIGGSEISVQEPYKKLKALIDDLDT